MQQATRPHAPSRRVSAIIGSSFITPSISGTEEHSVHACEDAENLPPPPAFLLEGSSPNASSTPQR